MANNNLIVAEQETGKTTYLLCEIDRLVSEKNEIIVLDSATEHEDKSLLRKVSSKYENSVVIDMRDEEQVVIDKIGYENLALNFTKYFPFNEIMQNKDKIICFDVSYFLERGHEEYDNYGNIDGYYHYRRLYNNLAEQIMLVLFLMDKFGLLNHKTVVMDEIEFPITDCNICKFQKGISVLSAVHPENAFGTFYTAFKKIEFKKYSKRKE